LRIRFLIAFIAIILSGCQSAAPTIEPPTPELIEKLSETPSTTPLPSLTATPPPLTITPTPPKLPEEWLLWNDSPHKSAAQGLTCETCHDTNGGSSSAVVAWLNQQTGKYEPVADTSALCNKCHADTPIKSQEIDLTGSVHSSFKCLDCHNPHSTAASCSNSGCHAGIRKPSDMPPATPSNGHPDVSMPICGGVNCHPAATQAAISNPTIHGARHASVACIACHDSSGSPLGPSGVNGIWLPLRTVEIDGSPTVQPFKPHSIQAKVDCTRCHFESNPWKLPLVSGHEFGN
jgi:hypothetical protein